MIGATDRVFSSPEFEVRECIEATRCEREADLFLEKILYVREMGLNVVSQSGFALVATVDMEIS